MWHSHCWYNWLLWWSQWLWSVEPDLAWSNIGNMWDCKISCCETTTLPMLHCTEVPSSAISPADIGERTLKHLSLSSHLNNILYCEGKRICFLGERLGLADNTAYDFSASELSALNRKFGAYRISCRTGIFFCPCIIFKNILLQAEAELSAYYSKLGAHR